MGRYSGIYYKSDSVKKCYSEFHLLISIIRNPAPAQGFSFYRFQNDASPHPRVYLSANRRRVFFRYGLSEVREKNFRG